MPDLIIKPKNQSGNKLILQDQAGGAVLTTADSGATAANVTLASTTTFPAGMSLQTKGDTYVPTSAINIETSSSLVLGDNLEVEITCKSTSNFLFVQSFIPDMANIGATQALHTGFKYSTASPFGSGTTLGGRDVINSHFGYQTNANGSLFGVSTQLWVAVPTTTTMKIQVYTYALNGQVKIFNNSNVSTFNVGSLIVTEVQG